MLKYREINFTQMIFFFAVVFTSKSFNGAKLEEMSCIWTLHFKLTVSQHQTRHFHHTIEPVQSYNLGEIKPIQLLHVHNIHSYMGSISYLSPKLMTSKPL